MLYVLLYTIYSFLGLLFLTMLVVVGWVVYTIINIFLTLREPALPNNFKKPDGETVEFYSTDGVALYGIFIRARGAAKGTIIFCPEVDAESRSCTKYCSFLADLGYNILSVDFRGHGNSSNLDSYVSRQWVSCYEIYDLLGAIEYLKDRGDIDMKKIGVFGVSRGGGTAICTAAQSTDIKVVITDSAFSTKKTLNAYMKKWTRLFLKVNQMSDFVYLFLENITIKVTEIKLGYKFPSVEGALREMKKPILMIHGTRDAYIGIDQARYLFGIANEPKTLLEVAGARHNESVVVNKDLYEGKITEFLGKHL